MTEKSFVRGNDRLNRMLREPGMTEAVTELEERAKRMNRSYAMSLAMIREAGQKTQRELAETLTISQGAVSRIERRDDMLLSTLRSYLEAAGATDARIVITINGQEVDLDLSRLSAPAGRLPRAS